MDTVSIVFTANQLCERSVSSLLAEVSHDEAIFKTSASRKFSEVLLGVVAVLTRSFFHKKKKPRGGRKAGFHCTILSTSLSRATNGARSLF